MTQIIATQTERVIGSKRETYEAATTNPPPNRTKIRYDLEEKGLSRNTVWRWIGWMAEAMIRCLNERPEAGVEQTILKAEKESFTFLPRQYRSQFRLDDLHRARWLRTHHKFGESALPRQRDGQL